MTMNTLIIMRINNAMPILKYEFGYPNISLLSSLPSSIYNNINIENVMNKNNTMMMMNASATSYHLDLYASSSSHSKEPPSQMVNIDVFESRNKNTRKKNGNKKNIDEEESKVYHEKNMDYTYVQFAT
jgi:hypothetical protein